MNRSMTIPWIKIDFEENWTFTVDVCAQSTQLNSCKKTKRALDFMAIVIVHALVFSPQAPHY